MGGWGNEDSFSDYTLLYGLGKWCIGALRQPLIIFQHFWFGPVVKEPMSGVILNGESALLLFFRSSNFEQFQLQQFRTFEHFHHAPSNDHEDDSIRPSQSSTRDESTTFSKEECPTPKLMSKLLIFIEQVLIVDQSATKRTGEIFRSLPKLFSDNFPALTSLPFDTADKQSRAIMSQLAPDIRDYAKMFENLSNLLRRCLEIFGDFCTKSLSDNNAVCPSMLISSAHHLWTLKKDPNLVRIIFMTFNSLVVRTDITTVGGYSIRGYLKLIKTQSSRYLNALTTALAFKLQFKCVNLCFGLSRFYLLNIIIKGIKITFTFLICQSWIQNTNGQDFDFRKMGKLKFWIFIISFAAENEPLIIRIIFSGWEFVSLFIRLAFPETRRAAPKNYFQIFPSSDRHFCRNVKRCRRHFNDAKSCRFSRDAFPIPLAHLRRKDERWSECYAARCRAH